MANGEPGLLLREAIAGVRVLGCRMAIDTKGVAATVPMLRGVFGLALHDLDPGAYEAVFIGQGPPNDRTPGYVLKHAPPDPGVGLPMMDFLLVGETAIANAMPAFRAWDRASGLGLGRERRPFSIRAMSSLAPDGRMGPWSLEASASTAPAGPCRVMFPLPLRLIRAGRLVLQPGVADLVVAGLRRLSPFVPASTASRLREHTGALVALARDLPVASPGWNRVNLVRYSGRQHREVEMQGVGGGFSLPGGCGPFLPLFAALSWLGVGKGTTVGMGALVLEEDRRGRRPQ